MRIAKRILVASTLSIGIAASTIGMAHASTAYVGGGTWEYGLTITTSYSHYYHGSRCHGATAVGRTVVRTNNIAAGRWARADAPRAVANNQQYWRHCP